MYLLAVLTANLPFKDMLVDTEPKLEYERVVSTTIARLGVIGNTTQILLRKQLHVHETKGNHLKQIYY